MRLRASWKGAGLRIALLSAGLGCWISAAERNWKLPPETARFKPGPGVELAVASCSLCHSADYISTQPPLDRAGWQASVIKMREKYGAPIGTNQIDAIVTYLAAQYGRPAK
jgi:mono/diheme cytochrome c family protein